MGRRKTFGSNSYVPTVLPTAGPVQYPRAFLAVQEMPLKSGRWSEIIRMQLKWVKIIYMKSVTNGQAEDIREQEPVEKLMAD